MKLTQLTLDTIPPMVELYYRMVLLARELPANGFPEIAQSFIPAQPENRIVLRKSLEHTRLPAICSYCWRVKGSIDGGKLYLGCPDCDGYRDTWAFFTRSRAIQSLVGFWATDMLYCHFLGMLVDEGRSKPPNNIDMLPEAIEQQTIATATRLAKVAEDKEAARVAATPSITALSAADIDAILEAL